MMQRLVQLALDLFDPPVPERVVGALPTDAGSAAQEIKQKLALFRFGWSATVQKNLLTPPEQEPFRCKKHCFAKR